MKLYLVIDSEGEGVEVNAFSPENARFWFGEIYPDRHILAILVA